MTSQLTLGGGERQLLRTARSLAGDGADVLVISTNPGRDAVDVEYGSDVAGVTVVDLAEGGLFERFRAARRQIVAFEPDLVVGWLKAATIWGPALAVTSRVRVFRLAERNRWAAYGSVWRVARLIAALFADRVVTNSEEALEEWRERSRRVDVVMARNFPPPYEPVVDESPVAGPATPVTLVLVGRLVRQKGVDIAIDALAIARRRGLDARLVIVGRDFDSGVTSAVLRHQAEEAGIAGDIEWRPPTLRSVRDARAWAQVLIAPSRWEGHSNVVAEALACGMGVVASDTVMPPPGTWFPRATAGDAEALAELLVSRAWEQTRVDPDDWADWVRLAGEEARAAWLGAVVGEP